MRVFIFVLLVSEILFLNPIFAKPPKKNFNGPNPHEWIGKLKKGGYIIMLRHTHRDRRGIAEIPPKIDNTYVCRPGTELTDLGKLEAKYIKRTIEEEKIPIGRVIASPTCRTVQMAKIIFGKYEIERALVFDRLFKNPIERNELLKKRAIIFTSVPKAGTNTILMGHQGTLGGVIEEGDGIILDPKAGGKVVGKLLRKHWLY